LKILQVISSLDPRGGGPAEGVRQFALASRDWGQSTTVVTLDSPDATVCDGDPFTVVALGPGLGGYCYSPRLVPWLRAHAREFDAVIVNGLWQHCGVAVRRALRGTGVPYFVFPHGMLDPYFKRAYPGKHLKKRLYWRWGEYRVLRDARAVFFTCEEELRLARGTFAPYRCREVVTGFGTAAPPVDAGPATAAFHVAFPELAGRRLLLFLGRIHEKKGCDLLIRTLASHVAGDSRWQLVFAGPVDAAYGARLRSLAAQLQIADRITWTGMLAGDQKWGALYAAEAFILPSHQENFGIAVTEALACGTPVLISDQVNIWREIDRDGAGLVKADTLQGTCELLRRWSELDDATRQDMRVRARACFETRFDIRSASRRLVETVGRLLATPA
jgi:glycosyltransferase involved in cell wall biosynthesis